jgi:hypothetical protein
MPFSLRKTNERQLAAGLTLISGVSPVIVFIGMFALWGAFSGQRSSFVTTCIGLLLAWFALACALDGISGYGRRARLWIWGSAAIFHLSLALLVWRLIGGFGIFCAAVELFVATFSLGGFFVAYVSQEPPETA